MTGEPTTEPPSDPVGFRPRPGRSCAICDCGAHQRDRGGGDGSGRRPVRLGIGRLGTASSSARKAAQERRVPGDDRQPLTRSAERQIWPTPSERPWPPVRSARRPQRVGPRSASARCPPSCSGLQLRLPGVPDDEGPHSVEVFDGDPSAVLVAPRRPASGAASRPRRPRARMVTVSTPSRRSR